MAKTSTKKAARTKRPYNRKTNPVTTEQVMDSEPYLAPAFSGPHARSVSRMFEPHDVIRMDGNHLVRGFRVWKITGHILGGLGQEDHYQMTPLDRIKGNSVEQQQVDCLVPCWLLETHPMIELA